MKIRWGAAIATRNRPNELLDLFTSIVEQPERPAAVAVADQSSPPVDAVRIRIEELAAAAGIPVLWGTGGTGASAGRNIAFRLLAGHVDWAVTPNDTSALDPTFGETLRRYVTEFPDAGCFAATYSFHGKPMRDPGPPGQQMLGWQLWTPIEPSCVWNVRHLLAVGGFDERIGTGSVGAAQSGEGTDLLVRIARQATVIAAPEIVVHGRTHGFGLRAKARAAKDHAYAIGTGVVYRRYFPGITTCARLVWPAAQGFLHALRHRDVNEIRCGMARARGRLYGYFASERALGPLGGTGNTSDRWRRQP